MLSEENRNVTADTCRRGFCVVKVIQVSEEAGEIVTEGSGQVITDEGRMLSLVQKSVQTILQN